MSAMVQIFSRGERWNVLFKKAKPSWIEHFIFHRMKIYVPLHKWKTFIICFFITSKNIFCNLEHLINLNILENAIMFWSGRFRPKVTAAYHSTLNCTSTQYYFAIMSHSSNGLFYITWSCIIQSNDKNLHWCYIKGTEQWIQFTLSVIVSCNFGLLFSVFFIVMIVIWGKVLTHIVYLFQIIWCILEMLLHHITDLCYFRIIIQ